MQIDRLRQRTGCEKLPDFFHVCARLVFRWKLFQGDQRCRQRFRDYPSVVTCDSLFRHRLPRLSPRYRSGSPAPPSKRMQSDLSFEANCALTATTLEFGAIRPAWPSHSILSGGLLCRAATTSRALSASSLNHRITLVIRLLASSSVSGSLVGCCVLASRSLGGPGTVGSGIGSRSGLFIRRDCPLCILPFIHALSSAMCIRCSVMSSRSCLISLSRPIVRSIVSTCAR